MIENISMFDFPTNTRIILEPAVLSPDYIPNRIIGRDDQINQVVSLMRYLFQHSKPDNALIFGPPGCGKNVVTKYVLTNLMIKLKRDPIEINVEWVTISCKTISTTNAVLYALIQHLDPNTSVKPSGYSMDFYYNALFQLMNVKNTALIVILDEIDFLRSDNVLYNFSRAIANEKLKDGRFISVIGLSNSIKFEKTLDPRVLSSMGFKKFSFPSYSADPILHILEDRIELAFATDSISKELLIECSIDAANVGGDIRKALSVLKTAAELATDDGVSQISKTHLKLAEETVQTEQIIKSVIELPRNHKIVLTSIVKLLSSNKTAYTGEVIQMCRALCEYIKIKPLHDTQVSRSVSVLELQSIIQLGKVNIGKKGGMTREISISTEDLDMIKRGIYEDYDLEILKDYYPIVHA